MMKFPVFAKAIEECNNSLKPYKMCLKKIMKNEDNILDNVVELLVGLVGMQVRN